MKNKNDIIKKQAAYINNLCVDTNKFVQSIDKKDIQTILLSGSVARGDFNPGKYGGMIDLTVMKKSGSITSAESLFGKDEEPDIPYHCITVNNIHYQILFLDYVDYNVFQTFEEPRKFAFLESQILWDQDNKYHKELELIEKYAKVDQYKKLNNCLHYIDHLISDYKVDRWYRRAAFCQMHDNLNTCIRLILNCLYYINNLYAPAEDRKLYYSFTLEKLPKNYEESIIELYKQTITSEADYNRREAIFKNLLLDFINKNHPTTAST
jgi:hypothetical protein